MNIWIVNHYAIPPSMGGLVRHYYFSKYLQEKGHKVKIFTSSKIHNTSVNIIKDKSLFKEEVEDGIEYTFVKSKDYSGNGLDRIINLIDLPFKIWRTMQYFIKQEKPDVIYTSSPDLFVALFAVIFGKIKKIPVIVEIRDLWPESVIAYNHISAKNPVIQLIYQMEKWLYCKADRLVFTMPGGKDYIQEKRWADKVNLDKIHYINNGVDIEEFEINQEKYQLDDKDLKNEHIFKVVYVGSIRLVNHLDTLIEAAAELKKQGYNDIQFLIYGSGTEKTDLEKKCDKLNLNVKFKGQVEKKYIPYILSKSNLNLINVKSASINRFGCSWNKLFEYMASGKPILCNLPVAYDIIEAEHIGITKKFANSKEYAESILEFKNMQQAEYSQYCINATSVAKNYDYKKLVDQVEELCKQVCQRR